MMSLSDLIHKAYKKLKGYAYFDKTQLPLVNKIINFESTDVNYKLQILHQCLSQSDSEWENYIEPILNNIDTLVYPKSLDDISTDQIVFNSYNSPVRLKNAQYFIDLPIEGHIISTLWVLTLGVYLDGHTNLETTHMYEHSYGNRLRKNLFDCHNYYINCSPHLFEPYFSQYERWRNKALEHANETLADKQDVLILTLDLKSFFYSVHIDEHYFNNILTSVHSNGYFNEPWVSRVHSFVYQVMKRYSNLVRRVNSAKDLPLNHRVFLPIGFLPSNIISNWVLTPIDEYISTNLNPTYYGRYVDDMIIVDKVAKNSKLHRLAVDDYNGTPRLKASDVIDHYFCNTSLHPGFNTTCNNAHLFIDTNMEITMSATASLSSTEKSNSYKETGIGKTYLLNPAIFECSKNSNVESYVRIQYDKVKVFYFREGASSALIDCFQKSIAINSSEFRFLPNMKPILVDNDYSEIFKLTNVETLHKLRGVTNVALDKFALSKFLGKYRKASRMIRNEKESSFDLDLPTFLDARSLIENYTLWERLLEIMIVNGHIKQFTILSLKIINAIKHYEDHNSLISDSKYLHHALLLTFYSAVCRTSALLWSSAMDEALSLITNDVTNKFPLYADFYAASQLVEQRKLYCRSRMINKYVLSLPIAWIDLVKVFDSSTTINLCHLEQCQSVINRNPFLEYPYYPYIITPQDISYALACVNIAAGKKIDDPKAQSNRINCYYNKLNYDKEPNINAPHAHESVKVEIILTAKDMAVNVRRDHDDTGKIYGISVATPPKSKIKLAIGNARLKTADFEGAMLRKPNRSLDRYQQVLKLINESLEEHVDLLILPENYIPWEWVPEIARLCANSQLALVTGIEHILSPNSPAAASKAYNLTAVILPYEQDDFKFSHVVYHHKVFYSPEEKREIKKYHHDVIQGSNYHLFHWKDLWFSVYCCYELASIIDRALFHTIADLTVAVEWNRDIPYFSSIIESLCRDLHCYCAQANSSDYGDSRIIAPSDTNTKDIIKSKGGTNFTILTDEIDLGALRNFQRRAYATCTSDMLYKPLPPDFDSRIPEHKQNGTLWDFLLKSN